MTASDRENKDNSLLQAGLGDVLAPDARQILDAIPLALFVKDKASRIVLMNRACEDLWGVSFADIGGTDASGVFPPEQIESFLVKDQAVLAGGQMVEFEENVWSPRLGENRIFRTIKKPGYDSAGHPQHLIGITLDVTNRVHSEAEYRTILKTTLDGFWINDLRGRFLDVNDAYCRMIGYERDELLAMSISDLEASERPDDTRAHIEKVLATGYDRFESRHRCKSGTILDVEVTVNYFPVAGGRLIVFVRDVTAQKKAETTLMESEARFRSIFENACTGIAFADGDGKAISFNDAFRQMLGYPKEQLRGMSFAEFTHADDLPRELQLLEEVAQGKRDHYTLEKRLIAADGEVKWIDGFVSAVRDPAGQVINFIGIATDITARRQAEATLNLYANVFQHSGEGIVITDADNNIVAVNRSFTRLTGYEEEDVLGENPRILASGKTPRETYQAMWGSLAAQDFWQGEVWERRKDGHNYPKWIAITALRDSFGAVTNYIASFTDITERKAVDER
ncbi:MAG: PAS domain S-box protein, partial [Sulfuricella sp.]